jgi:hypothetical protein
LSNNAHSEWTKVGENLNGTAYFIDMSTIESIGQYRRVWELEAYRQPNKLGISSLKIRKEYDCKKQVFHYVNYVGYTGHFGDGDQVGAVNTPGHEEPFPQNLSGRAILRMVCPELNWK